jgi:hypothetical protein
MEDGRLKMVTFHTHKKAAYLPAYDRSAVA